MIVGIAQEIWVLAAFVAVLAGVVKGAVGFAMPMIMISGISSFAAPELALAALIIPTLATNLMQTLRGGVAQALAAMKKYRVYIVVLLATIALSAQAVAVISTDVLLLLVGIPITLISLTQLLGWRPQIAARSRRLVEVFVALFAGALGGIGGVWGPPTTSYLTAIGTPKAEQIRVQGVIYGAAAIVLLLSHLRSGILHGQTLTFSAVMVVPAVAGMIMGFRLQDGLDQAKFRRVTLIVLIIAGLNLIRRGLAG